MLESFAVVIRSLYPTKDFEWSVGVSTTTTLAEESARLADCGAWNAVRKGSLEKWSETSLKSEFAKLF